MIDVPVVIFVRSIEHLHLMSIGVAKHFEPLSPSGRGYGPVLQHSADISVCVCVCVCVRACVRACVCVSFTKTPEGERETNFE